MTESPVGTTYELRSLTTVPVTPCVSGYGNPCGASSTTDVEWESRVVHELGRSMGWVGLVRVGSTFLAFGWVELSRGSKNFHKFLSSLYYYYAFYLYEAVIC